MPTDLYPWLVLDMGESQAVRRVQIFNRAGCCGDELTDVEVRISDTKPTSAEEHFTEGSLLGNYDGWASTGQMITMEKSESSMGRYVVVQHNSKGVIKWVDGHWKPANKDKGGAGLLDIAEVKVFGGKLHYQLYQ